MPALSPCPSPGSSLPVFAGRSMDPSPFYEGGCRAGLRHAPSSYETSHEGCAGGHQQSAKLGRSSGNCSSSPWSGGEREKSSAFFGRKGDKWREAAAKIWEPEMGFPPGADCKTGTRWGSRARPDSQAASCCRTDVWRGSIPSARPTRTPLDPGTRRACGEGGSVVPRQREGSGLGKPALVKLELMRYWHGRELAAGISIPAGL